MTLTLTLTLSIEPTALTIAAALDAIERPELPQCRPALPSPRPLWRQLLFSFMED